MTEPIASDAANATQSLRTMLYVPADRPAMIAKARDLDADAVILDLEDSVAPARKDTARATCVEAVTSWPSSAPEVWVRINAITTAVGEQDLRALLGARQSRVVVPMIDRHASRRLADRLDEIPDASAAISMVGLVETARGLIDAPYLLEVLPQLVALQFGAEDFTTDMGIARSLAGDEIRYARSALAVAARAQGLAAIDTPLVDFHDLDAVRRDAHAALDLGFTGKACIHPNQLDPVQATFTPSADEVARARQILDALSRAEADGRGATSLNGRMIDAPVAERARALLARERRSTAQSRPSHQQATGTPHLSKGKK